MAVDFELDGRAVTVDAVGVTLLDALRDHLGVRSVKDGCGPQGQCGCCTVLVDGTPRVSCVTPLARVRGRTVTTVDGLDDASEWAQVFCATGASQCGFCTPGIVVRLSSVATTARADRDVVDRALLAHLCRCTGWQTIREAAAAMSGDVGEAVASVVADRDLDAAARRATLEGGTLQRVGPDVALGRGGFADDGAPAGALVAVPAGDGWAVAETVAAARERAGTVQGRRTTAPVSWPIDPPDGEWDRTLTTTWIDPAALEPDAAWCEPGGDPVGPDGNGGAFGSRSILDVGAVARRLADEHGRALRVVLSREDMVRTGLKRPPVALGLRLGGTGSLGGSVAVVTTPGSAVDPDEVSRLLAVTAPGVDIAHVADTVGPPVDLSLRGAVWAEVAGARAACAAAPDEPVEVTAPDGGIAAAEIEADGSIRVTVDAGQPLDEVVLRSYCIGAAHMALGIVRSEAISVDDAGVPLDLTIRSFGVLRSVDTPEVAVDIRRTERPPVNGGDAVFAAVLGAAWRHAGFPARLPSP